MRGERKPTFTVLADDDEEDPCWLGMLWLSALFCMTQIASPVLVLDC